MPHQLQLKPGVRSNLPAVLPKKTITPQTAINHTSQTKLRENTCPVYHRGVGQFKEHNAALYSAGLGSCAQGLCLPSLSFAKPLISSSRSTWSLEVIWNCVQDCHRSPMLFKSIPEKHLLWARWMQDGKKPLHLCCLYSFYSQEYITGWELAMWETSKSCNTHGKNAFGICILTFGFFGQTSYKHEFDSTYTPSKRGRHLHKAPNQKPQWEYLSSGPKCKKVYLVLAPSIWKFRIFSPNKCILLLSHRKRNCYEIGVFPNIQLSKISNAFVMAGQYLVPQLSCLSPSCGGYGINEVANFLYNWCQLLL